MSQCPAPLHSIYLLAMSVAISAASILLLRILAYEWCLENRVLVVFLVALVSISPPVVYSLWGRKSHAKEDS